MTCFLSERKSERDAGGGGRGRVAAGLEGGVVVATGTGAQEVHGVGADGGGWGAVADGPAAASRARPLKPRGRPSPARWRAGMTWGAVPPSWEARGHRPQG